MDCWSLVTERVRGVDCGCYLGEFDGGRELAGVVFLGLVLAGATYDTAWAGEFDGYVGLV